MMRNRAALLPPHGPDALLDAHRYGLGQTAATGAPGRSNGMPRLWERSRFVGAVERWQARPRLVYYPHWGTLLTR